LAYKISLISTRPAVYAVIAVGNDGKKRTVGRYQTLRAAELRVKRFRPSWRRTSISG
jgi:hypothetical protein